jgi:hypothetical protein
MNTGMQDACNLAWKLALVVRRLASDRLLESYSAERSPVAEQVLKVTGRATSMATATSEVVQFLRNHTASLILGLAPLRNFAATDFSEIAIVSMLRRIMKVPCPDSALRFVQANHRWVRATLRALFCSLNLMGCRKTC